MGEVSEQLAKNMRWAYLKGYALIPLKDNEKIPATWWKPYIDRKPTDEEYKKWKEQGLFSTGYGIVTGKVSGISVLDIDMPKGMDNLAKHDLNVLDLYTWQVDTPNGRHYYFKYDELAKQGQAVFGDGVDIRNDGGFVVGPGSMVDSNFYLWAFDYGPNDVILSLMPEWMKKGSGNRVDKDLVTFEGIIRNGERNKKLASLAGTLFNKEFPSGVVRGVLEYINQNYTDTPVDKVELDNIVRSIARYHGNN
jgi:hypothetical protein